MTNLANGRQPLLIDGGALGIADVEETARQPRPVTLAPAVRARLDQIRRAVDAAALRDEAIYGVNTGFGSLSRVRIAPERVREVQRNLVRSHAAGVGEALPDDVVRAMMLILAASLARGHSGVRPIVVERLIDLLNRAILPVIPSRGSVGASGDLAPLAHLALVLIGEGEATIDGRRCSGADALARAGLAPMSLEAKEGLALVNGTHLMSAVGSLALVDAHRLFEAALGACAMSIDACRATDAFLDDRLHAARNQPGQRAVAARLREFLRGSQIIVSHKQGDPRVQDPYCLRAAPQVLGACADALAFSRAIIERELAGVTDNPLVFTANGDNESVDFVSGGNFHGMPLALALDLLSITLCHVAGISERRINWLLTASDSENPINPHLSPHPGLHSGLMIAQYTAAACCNELQTLAHPASVHNIPTCAGMEDYNSMGATSALRARQAIELARTVVAIEFLVMAEALEYQRPLRSGDGIERLFGRIRKNIPRLTADRPPGPDVTRLAAMVERAAL
jgi:histidine ammonia-lyase